MFSGRKKKTFWPKKILGRKKIWGPKSVRAKKMCPIIKDNKKKVPKKFKSEKNVEYKNKLPKLV